MSNVPGDHNSIPERPAPTVSPEVHGIVLSNISDAVFITDEDGRFTYVCPNVAIIFGHTFAEVSRAGNISFLLGDQLIDARELDETGEICNIELDIDDRDGVGHALLVNVKRVAIEGGTLLYTCRDISERKRAEEALRRSEREIQRLARQHQDELAHAARFSSMGELTSGLAHELNQPLSAITNFSQACIHKINGGIQEPGNILAMLQQISAQAHRAGEIVQRVRRFLVKQAPRRVVLDVEKLIEDAMELVEPTVIRAGSRLDLDLPDHLPKVQVDPIEFQQIVINLVCNALEAQDEVGRSTQPVRVSASMPDENEVEVAVHDSGVGFSDEELEQMFEPFYTTKEGGLGLGLSVSRSIVESHGGRLWAERRETEGSVFRFTLPIRKL